MKSWLIKDESPGISSDERLLSTSFLIFSSSLKYGITDDERASFSSRSSLSVFRIGKSMGEMRVSYIHGRPSW